MNSGNQLYANTPSSGSPSGFNTLFATLERIRSEHYSAKDKNTNNQTNLKTAFSTSVVSSGTQVQKTAADQVKTYLTTLNKSTWLSGTNFAAKITLPAVGELVEAADFESWESVLEDIDAICPNYSNYSQYSNYSNQYFNGYEH